VLELEGWRAISIRLPSGHKSVDVYYGHEEDHTRPPTLVTGLSTVKTPALHKSIVFNKMYPGNSIQGLEAHNSGDTIAWAGNSIQGLEDSIQGLEAHNSGDTITWAGNSIQGLEAHNSGDTIGWEGPDPLTLSTSISTWLSQRTFPGAHFRFILLNGHVYVIHGTSELLHTFQAPLYNNKAAVYLHLFLQNDATVGCQTDVRYMPESEKNTKRHNRGLLALQRHERHHVAHHVAHTYGASRRGQSNLEIFRLDTTKCS